MDGHAEALTANIIAENIIAQFDEEGHRKMMLCAIMDHRAVLIEAIPKAQGTCLRERLWYQTFERQRREVGNCWSNRETGLRIG